MLVFVVDGCCCDAIDVDVDCDEVDHHLLIMVMMVLLVDVDVVVGVHFLLLFVTVVVWFQIAKRATPITLVIRQCVSASSSPGTFESLRSLVVPTPKILHRQWHMTVTR